MDTPTQVRKGALHYIQLILGLLLLLALSATFLYSAYSKSGIRFSGFHMLPDDNAFDRFQWTFLDLGINSIVGAGIIARLMIGFELFLGLMLLSHVFLKKFTYPAIVGLLAIFIIYLTVIILKQGNSGNCGCFGDKLQMTPLQAIYKNIAMIVATVILWFIYPLRKQKYPHTIETETLGNGDAIIPVTNVGISDTEVELPNNNTEGAESVSPTLNTPLVQEKKKGFNLIKLIKSEPIYMVYVAMFVATIAFTVPFLVNNIFIGTEPVRMTQALDLDLLYKNDTIPNTDLRKGKHIIAFMSLTCPHCRKAGILMGMIHQEHPEIPLYMVLNGSNIWRKAFFDETRSEKVPYILYKNTPDFIKMSGTGVPSIFWVNDGVVEYKSVMAYYQLDPAFMQAWLKTTTPAPPIKK